MVSALKEGVIDLIATDHAPHGTVDKQTTFADAANGISNLETALGSLLSLVHLKDINLVGVIEKLTVAPARFLGRDDIGSLSPGTPADVTIIDTEEELFWKKKAKGHKDDNKWSSLNEDGYVEVVSKKSRCWDDAETKCQSKNALSQYAAHIAGVIGAVVLTFVLSKRRGC